MMAMKIVVIADEDFEVGLLECRNIDILISCGDLNDRAIQRAMEIYQPKLTLAVRGNHDVDAPFPKGVVDLHLTTHVFEGVKFGGFEGCWKYKSRGHHLFEQAEVSNLMKYFPKVDVFVAHNSPAGIHERDTEVHQGFLGFKGYIERAEPSLMIHGHQHVDTQSVVHQTTVIGVFGEIYMEIQLPA